jgi:hypothetical protein
LILDLANIAIFFAFLYDLQAKNKLVAYEKNLLTAALALILIRLAMFAG